MARDWLSSRLPVRLPEGKYSVCTNGYGVLVPSVPDKIPWQFNIEPAIVVRWTKRVLSCVPGSDRTCPVYQKTRGNSVSTRDLAPRQDFLMIFFGSQAMAEDGE
eukprot:SAG31_NODE_2348_length_5895_cov_69.747930_7_plen_104_part_00